MLVNSLPMIKVMLINQDRIPHYRVPVYNYLSEYLKKNLIALTVVSGGIQMGNPHSVEFEYRELPLTFRRLAKLVRDEDPEVVIFWINLKYLYLFPFLIFCKLMGKRIIYWGHGRDLLDKGSILKNTLYAIEHLLSDAIILYAEHLKKYVLARFLNKVFIANNTLNMTIYQNEFGPKAKTLSKYNIKTKKNIICMGRMQRRKKIQDLVKALKLINNEDIGLILAGPDTDGILREFDDANIYKLGTVYGLASLELLSAADVYCLPGAVGLSIVDAFYCGLPFITGEGVTSPEIMYLKDGINGFIVPKGDIKQLAARLNLLLEDDALRDRFSRAARHEILLNGHIEIMCKGFCDAIQYVGAQRNPNR
jgi:glycosyltransferase involved in cell wall biosynthesis